MNELCVPPNWQALGMTLNFNPWFVNVCQPASRKKKTYALTALTDNKSDTFVKDDSGRKSHKMFVRFFVFLLFLDGIFLNCKLIFSQVEVRQATADTWCYLEKNLELGKVSLSKSRQIVYWSINVLICNCITFLLLF